MPNVEDCICGTCLERARTVTYLVWKQCGRHVPVNISFEIREVLQNDSDKS